MMKIATQPRTSRERAMELLLDHYGPRKPTLPLNLPRPNQISREALLEHALLYKDYDIDSIDKFEDLFEISSTKQTAKHELFEENLLAEFFRQGDLSILEEYVRRLVMDSDETMVPGVATILAQVRQDDPDFHCFLQASDDSSSGDPSDERQMEEDDQDGPEDESDDQAITIEPGVVAEEKDRPVYPFGPHDDKYFDTEAPEYASLPLLKLLKYLVEYLPAKGPDPKPLMNIVVTLYHERERLFQDEGPDETPDNNNSLENKGLRRKALAAAFEQEQKRLDQLQEKIKTYTDCLLTALRRLLDYMRNAVWETKKDAIVVAVPHELWTCLDDLSKNPKEPQALPLYSVSILVWAECVAVTEERMQTLQEYAENHTSKEMGKDLTLESCDCSAHRLWAICRRFRVSDVLDDLVSRPAVLSAETKELGSPNKVASTFEWIRKSLDNREDPALMEFYWALTHRMHARVLLMDGLYTVAIEDVTNSSSLAVDSMTADIKASPDLCFDSTKCAQSMSLLTGPEDVSNGANAAAVHQRASKVWGTVLCTQYFNPKSGIHRWAVRLDKCERGHVFIGVATARAGLKTYVGGDKFGWGMIGTQALWHERRKIRGDYGSTFRTGSTIIVTLDTDLGTLSYSLWKSSKEDNNGPSSGLLSPRRSNASVGTIENWGVAFEGLPLDSKLFPAIGLYQRDDRVTLMKVEDVSMPNEFGLESSSAQLYFPPDELHASKDTRLPLPRDVRSFNEKLLDDALLYIDGLFAEASRDKSKFVASLTSMIAAISLFPSTIPVLSDRIALNLLPKIESALDHEQKGMSNDFPVSIRNGQWDLVAQTNRGPEKYCVVLTCSGDASSRHRVHGAGTGLSGRSQNDNVVIDGVSYGLKLSFIEQWDENDLSDVAVGPAEESTFNVVNATVSLDGCQLRGIFFNTDTGESGLISGKLGESSGDSRSKVDMQLVHLLLSVAIGHFATTFSVSQVSNTEVLSDDETSIMKLLDLSLLSSSCLKDDFENFAQSIDRFGPSYFLGTNLPTLELNYPISSCHAVDDLNQRVVALDSTLAPKNGGLGTLRIFDPVLYTSARQNVIAAALYHCGLDSSVTSAESDSSPDEKLSSIWLHSLRVVEDETRFLIQNVHGDERKKCCQERYQMIVEISQFLVSLDTFGGSRSVEEAFKDISTILLTIRSSEHLRSLEKLMENASRKALRDLVSLKFHERALATNALTTGVPFLTEYMTESFSTLVTRVSNDKRERKENIPELGNCEVIGPACSSISLRSWMSQTIDRVFDLVCSKSEGLLEHVQKDQKDFVPLASMSLATIEMMARRNGLRFEKYLKMLERMLRVHTHSLNDQILTEIDDVDDDLRVWKMIDIILVRDVSRLVLRSCASVVHNGVKAFVIDQRTESGDKTERMKWLCYQTAIIFTASEQANGTNLTNYFQSLEEMHWRQWVKVAAPKHAKKRNYPMNRNSALLFLEKMSHLWYLDAENISSTSEKQKSGSKRWLLTPVDQLRGSFVNYFLSDWMDILFSLMTVKEISEYIENDYRWGDILFRALGILIERREDGHVSDVKSRDFQYGTLPSHHRARIFILLRHFLRLFKRNLSSHVFELVFQVTGSECMTRRVDDVEGVVGREAVAFLRLVAGLEDYRTHLFEAVQTVCKTTSFAKRAGLLAFLNGAAVGVECLSYVLIKPTTITGGLPESQSMSGSKTNGGLSAFGLDSIIGGLLRSEASGGIVSSIDGKNGICEVLIMEKESSGIGYHDLAVRAVKTPLHEVMGAQEVPLVVLEPFPAVTVLNAFMAKSLDSLHSAMGKESKDSVDDAKTGEEKSTSDKEKPDSSEVDGGSRASQDDETSSGRETPEITEEDERDDSKDKKPEEAKSKKKQSDLRSGVYTLAFDLMALRSCLVLLSEKEVLDFYITTVEGSTALRRLMDLAWPEPDLDNPKRQLIMEGRDSPLSSLAISDAGFSHSLTLLRDLSLRNDLRSKIVPDLLLKRLEMLNVAENQGASGPSGIDEPPSSASQGRARSALAALSNSLEGVTSAQATAASRENDGASNRSISQSTGGSQSDDDDQVNEPSSSNALSALRDAAIVQMGELGIPRSYAEIALRRTGGIDIEAAVHFCLENGTEIERILAAEMDRQAGSGNRGGMGAREENHLLRQLQEMGFPRRWCQEALAATGNSVDEALTWILTNNEMLENLEPSDDEEEDNDDDDDESLESEDDSVDDESDSCIEDAEAAIDHDSKISEGKPGWQGISCPLKLISGKATIDPDSLDVSGISNGGFASVGAKGILLTKGKWYYEVQLKSSGCIQLGFGDSTFASHCNADRGDGCGDSSSSYSFDGWRCLRWHSIATRWGCRWKEDDVVGCLLDLDDLKISFTLNGEGEAVGMGQAFQDIDYSGGLYPVVSFNRREKLKIILGGRGDSFRFGPPPGFSAVGDAYLASMQEFGALAANHAESIDASHALNRKEALLDLSDEDHGYELFSWSHRYYGADASVHLGSRSRAPIPRTPAPQNIGTVEVLVRQHLEKAFSQLSSDTRSMVLQNSDECNRAIHECHETIEKEIAYEAFCQAMKVSVLVSRKLLLHIIANCLSEQTIDILFGEYSISTKAWRAIEHSVATKGWSGEAGAMAIAAEALGLGIQLQVNKTPEVPKVFDSSRFLAAGGFYQLLNTFGSSQCDSAPSRLVCAAAEFCFCSEAGSSSLVFLRDGLLALLKHSGHFRKIVLTRVSEALRLLTMPDVSTVSPSEEDESSEELEETTHTSPDTRLVCFCTGLLLSPSILHQDELGILNSLFRSWSIGLLSSSLPWRMVCALTIAGIVRLNTSVVDTIFSDSSTVVKFYGRLHSTVARRFWAERAAFPICSRYTQSLLELLIAIRKGVDKCERVPSDFRMAFEKIYCEPACPKPLPGFDIPGSRPLDSWELESGFVSNEHVVSGVLKINVPGWSKPNRGAIRNLMDGDEGPPMLRVGCKVIRGPSWDQASYGNADGNDIYEAAKAERLRLKKEYKTQSKMTRDDADPEERSEPEGTEEPAPSKKKVPHPNLAIGVITAIEEWDGVKGKGRRVKWAITGEEHVYRFGGEGGKFDLVHVETNKKETKIKTKYPHPETDEQFASRKNFGVEKEYGVLIRMSGCETGGRKKAIMEVPDLGAALKIELSKHDDCILVEQKEIHYGSRNSGWESLYGTSYYVPGLEFKLAPTQDSSIEREMTNLEAIVGKAEVEVPNLRNPSDGSRLVVEQELILHAPPSWPFQEQGVHPLPLRFDSDFHASSLNVSGDGRTVTCTTPEGRGTAFATLGFSKGVHYWEVKLEQADIGSVFIGCAEKPGPDEPPRLNRWHGWGFVNFRASYASGSERVYGVHAHAGDTIGVLLDCDAGRLSFFYDGLKYGEHILSDLGCAFENMSPFGFSADGCSTGGYGQAAPNGFGRNATQSYVRPRTLWPVVGLRNQGDRVTFSRKWSSVSGIDGVAILQNALHFESLLTEYNSVAHPSESHSEAFSEMTQWVQGDSIEIVARATGNQRILLDRSFVGCAAASAALGLSVALLPGDRIRLRRSEGRLLELDEDVIVLGQSNLRLFYQIYAQKNEGQSLSEGGDKAHWFDEYDFIEPIQFLSTRKGQDAPLPLLDRFKYPCKHGLKVIYKGGAVVRSDIEISDTSLNLGTIECGTLISGDDVLECRINSCGVKRYKIRYNDAEGYISAKIRGGDEEDIVEVMDSSNDAPDSSSPGPSYSSPFACARQWLIAFENAGGERVTPPALPSIDTFVEKVNSFRFDGMSAFESDKVLVCVYNIIADNATEIDALNVTSYYVAETLKAARSIVYGQGDIGNLARVDTCEAVAKAFVDREILQLPEVDEMMARLSYLRLINRRARHALPWFSLQHSQEGSAIAGGVYGFGNCQDRSMRNHVICEDQSWTKLSSFSTTIRKHKGILFSGTKRFYLESIINASTTPTALSHDEYELPREIRTVRINRLKASRAMKSSDFLTRRKFSVFAQLQSELRSLGGAALRRAYVAKGHGGQKRAFKIKFVGEGVNDYSGPYREVFSDANKEIIDVHPDDETSGSLGVLDPSPNRVSGIGDQQDLYMFSSNGKDVDTDLHHFELTSQSPEDRVRSFFAPLLLKQDEATREVEEALVFLGRLTGTALRHSIPMDLPLSTSLVWDPMTGKPVTDANSWKDLDFLAVKHRQNSSCKVWWQSCMLNAFLNGLGSVVPLEPMLLFTGEELKTEICGTSTVDVRVLKRIVEYEGYNANDEVISFFWETLQEEFSEEDRKAFLQFVWARSRLPARETDFEAPFKIQKDAKNDGDNADIALPGASTCFFTLTLPPYSSKEILVKKLKFAIHNVRTMETDFQTNTAEISEGYRAL